VTERLLPGLDADLPLAEVRPRAAGYEIEEQLVAAGALWVAGVDALWSPSRNDRTRCCSTVSNYIGGSWGVVPDPPRRTH